MHIVTISSKRQITIPKRLLEGIGLDSFKKAMLEKEENRIVLRPIKKSIVAETAGSLKKYVHPSLLRKDPKEVEEEAKRLYAKHLAQKYGLKR